MSDWNGVSTRINNALAVSLPNPKHWYEVAFSPDRAWPWYSSALSRIWVLIGDDEIRYASAAVDSRTVAAVVTDRLIIAVRQDTKNGATATVTAYRVAALERLHITNSGHQRTESRYPDWPGPFEIRIDLGDDTITLPLGPASDDNRRELVELTKALVEEMRSA